MKKVYFVYDSIQFDFKFIFIRTLFTNSYWSIRIVRVAYFIIMFYDQVYSFSKEQYSKSTRSSYIHM